jgi:hypothetical protein
MKLAWYGVVALPRATFLRTSPQLKVDLADFSDLRGLVGKDGTEAA